MKNVIYCIQMSRAPKVKHRPAHARMQAGLCLTLGIGRMPYSEMQRSGIELRTCDPLHAPVRKAKRTCSKERTNMKISTKGRYALRLMLDLAVNNDGTPVSIRDIAARQGISDKYLEQIIASLNKAGYVRSSRGPQGGYTLTKAPKDYTVGMILQLTEGSLAPVSCLDEDQNVCDRQDSCATLRLWKQLDDAIKGVVDNVTLEDLMNWQDESVGNYVI